MHCQDQAMFDPKEESLTLEIVSGFFNISEEEMMKIGDATKDLLLGPEAVSEEAVVQRLKAALEDMPKEHVLIAGVFISGLLRCNLERQAEQYMQTMAQCDQEPE
jgi:hypothetical protein